MPAAGGPVVVVVACAQRDQGAVTLGAKLDVEARRRGRAADHELLLPGEREPQRAVHLARQQDEKRLEQDHLSAEAAAHWHGDDPHLMGRRVEQRGNLVAEGEGTLCRGPDRHAASGLGPHESDVRLDERLVHAGDAIGRLDDDVGAGEAGLSIAALERRHRADVAGPRDRFGFRVGGGAVHGGVGFRAFAVRLQHLRRGFPHRPVRTCDDLERLVVDLDQRSGVPGGGLGFGDHRGHRLTRIEHPFERQGLVRTACLHVREVGPDDHCHHAGSRASGGDLDAPDPGARQVAQDHLHMQESREIEIGREPGRPVGLGLAFLPPHPATVLSHVAIMARSGGRPGVP